MTISSIEITIVQLISLLAIVQGLGWAILSFICIVLHNISKDMSVEASTYEEVLELSLYYRFIKDNGALDSTNFVVRSTDFTVFMWIYFLSSAIWVALSIDLYIAAKNDKKRLSTVMILWSVDAILFSVVDIILMSLLARDYENCEDLNAMCHITTGITMTLAIRGYLLWFINVICCVVLLKLGIRIKKHDFAQRNVVIPRPKLGISDNTNGNNSWRNSNYPGENNSWINGKKSPETPVGNRDWPGGQFGEPQYMRENRRFV